MSTKVKGGSRPQQLSPTPRSPVNAARTQAIARMNEELKQQYQVMQNRRAEMASAGIEYYWHMGVDVQTVQADPSKYTGNAVVLLSEALDVSTGILYKAALFAKHYTEEDLAKLLELRTPSNASLTWTHVTHLLSVERKAVRERLQAQAARHDWSSEDLRRAVIEDRGIANKRPGSGRKFEKPKTVVQGLRNFLVGADEFQRRDNEVWEGVFSDVAELPPEAVDDVIFEQIERAVTTSGQLLERAKHRQAQAQEVLRRFREIRANQDAPADEDPEDENEARDTED